MTQPATPPKPGDWMESAQTLANIGHCLGGACVLLVTVLFTHDMRWVAGVECVLAAYVLAKEYGYDLKYETGETFWTSTEDALGYVAGNAVAWCLVGLAIYLGRWP